MGCRMGAHEHHEHHGGGWKGGGPEKMLVALPLMLFAGWMFFVFGAILGASGAMLKRKMMMGGMGMHKPMGYCGPGMGMGGKAGMHGYGMEMQHHHHGFGKPECRETHETQEKPAEAAKRS